MTAEVSGGLLGGAVGGIVALIAGLVAYIRRGAKMETDIANLREARGLMTEKEHATTCASVQKDLYEQMNSNAEAARVRHEAVIAQLGEITGILKARNQ